MGGESTHCVISGHRGLPSARLFTDLDQLTEGDTFILHVLDETLTYEVDQISVVEPDDISLLEIEAGEDLCTLVTCTPYGVNSHRLLVRGHRVETPEEGGILQIIADAVLIDERYGAAHNSNPHIADNRACARRCGHAGKRAKREVNSMRKQGLHRRGGAALLALLLAMACFTVSVLAREDIDLDRSSS